MEKLDDCEDLRSAFWICQLSEGLCLRLIKKNIFFLNSPKDGQCSKKKKVRVFCFPKMRFTFVNCKTTHSAKAKDTVKNCFNQHIHVP